MNSQLFGIAFVVAISVFVAKVEAEEPFNKPQELRDELTYCLLKLLLPEEHILYGALSRSQKLAYRNLQRLSVSEQQELYKEIHGSRGNIAGLTLQLLYPDEFVLLETLTPNQEAALAYLKELPENDQETLYETLRQPLKLRYKNLVEALALQSVKQEQSVTAKDLSHWAIIRGTLETAQLMYDQLLQQLTEQHFWPYFQIQGALLLNKAHKEMMAYIMEGGWQSECEEKQRNLDSLKLQYQKLKERIQHQDYDTSDYRANRTAIL